MRRILVIGAHPDDADIFCGGTAMLWRERGDMVRFISVTDGSAGHHILDRDALRARRIEETRRAAAIADIEYDLLEHRDGELLPTLEARNSLIRLIRRFQPDLVLTHRPGDYHPDHRYTSSLVLDSAYMVTVPLVCPDTRALERNPVLGYLWDEFRKPTPFEAHVAVSVDPVMERKWEMLCAHASQFFEWLPFNMGSKAPVPEGADARRAWINAEWGEWLERPARLARSLLATTYGDVRAVGVRFAEVFEIGEHGRQPVGEELRELFPLP